MMPDSEGPSKIAQVAAAEVPGLSGLLGLAVGVVVVAALYLARDVLVPIMLAVLLSFVLAPLVSVLRRLRLPRTLAVITTVVLALGVIGVLGSVIGMQIAALADNAPRYAATIEHKVVRVRESTVGELPKLIARLSHQFDRASGNGDAAPVRHGTLVGTVQRPMQVALQTPPTTPLGLIRSLLGPLLGPLETTVIVLIVAIFILLQREDLRDRLIRLFGSNDLHRTTTAMDDAAARLGRYFLFQLGLNSVFGLIIATGLYLIGVPSPLLWGILAGLLRFVPYIGSFLAALPPLVLAAAVGADWSMMIAVAALFLITEPIMGYIVEPMVYGHSTGLSPAAVIIAAVFWTWLWGPVGLVLSTPLTLCLVVLGRHFDRLEFLDVLLGDRPALSPVESFYQRLLAGDADELLAQAELLLAERSLSSYYDEIAVKGLRLAAADADRGVLGTAQMTRVRQAITGLLGELADHRDNAPVPDQGDLPVTLAEKAVPRGRAVATPAAALPPAWSRDGAVLCVAGRGVLDEAAATMMAQLLGKHGLGARVVGHDAVSRERLASFDSDGAMLVCICGVEFSGTAPPLRFLLRRLHGRLPGIPILVALWTDTETGSEHRAAIGADQFAGSIREVVTLCQSIAVKSRDSDEQMLSDAFGQRA